MAKQRKYTEMCDGDIVVVGHGKYFYNACCDCALVHKLSVKIDKDADTAVITVHRDNRRTAQLRRYAKEKRST